VMENDRMLEANIGTVRLSGLGLLGWDLGKLIFSWKRHILVHFDALF